MVPIKAEFYENHGTPGSFVPLTPVSVWLFQKKKPMGGEGKFFQLIKLLALPQGKIIHDSR